jgi:type I restriction-modification system DNA methylase subunit
MTKHISERRTEDIAQELLDIQGWALGRPPKGQVLRQNEYKDYPQLAEIFSAKKNSGHGDTYPDFLVLSQDTLVPLMVVETKADEQALEECVKDGCEKYGDPCREAGHEVVVVAVAGQESTRIMVRSLKFHRGRWRPIEHQEIPISWIPTPEDVPRLLAAPGLLDLAPIVPRAEVLASKADLINRILREANIKDEYRPAYVGAMMLALWYSGGSLRRDPKFVLRDINAACEDAFSGAGKPELARSLNVAEANAKFASTAWRILATLEKLNVVNASIAHDYLGQLYETFFRYTGGNTIGQYFTPRHITRFMADVCQTSPTDYVIDPACGTGGFLIACIQRAFDISKVTYKQAVNMVRNRLIGYESEPVTAALCVANMILRGDGKAGVRKADCFSARDYPVAKCQVALMNPPFPHKKTDIPPQKFIERALEALQARGMLAVILPTSLIVKKEVGAWRKQILSKNSLVAVCQMPDELFQPYSSSTTSVVFLEKGISQSPSRRTAFVRLQFDGLTLKKGTRVRRPDAKNDIPRAVQAILNNEEIPGFSGLGTVSGDAEWAPGAYIPSALPTEEELKDSIDTLLRRLASFYVRYAPQVARLRSRISSRQLAISAYRQLVGEARVANAVQLSKQKDTIGALFDIFYGQRELHSRDGIPPGETLVISPTEQYNGCYGWLSFEPLIEPPFITVAQTGSIGEAFVQLEPCAVNDDCLILLPREGHKVALPVLFVAASVIRLERWRFTYGRKLTPSRICAFPMPRIPRLEKWVAERLDAWLSLANSAINAYSTNANDLGGSSSSHHSV